jgi:hypothetical protein
MGHGRFSDGPDVKTHLKEALAIEHIPSVKDKGRLNHGPKYSRIVQYVSGKEQVLSSLSRDCRIFLFIKKITL